MNGNGGHKNGEGSGETIPRDWDDFCRFIETNYGVIYTVALAHVRDVETAQEIAQDVCVRVLLEREKLGHITNTSGWLARVARNTAVDWIRRRQTHSRILAMMENWNKNEIAAAGNAGGSATDARHAAMKSEENTRLYGALERLAPEDREMLLLHYMDGKDKRAIAGLLEMHPSTVGRRIDRALREMRRGMRDFEPDALRRLRPAEHAGRSAQATLVAAAALTAAQKASLAAVAAPLPVLSAGAGAVQFLPDLALQRRL